MDITDRELAVEVVAALTYWPGIIWVGQKNPPDPVDLTVLPPFFNEVLQGFPWWNRDWSVVHVEPGWPVEVETDFRRNTSRLTEVSVPGTVGCSRGETLPFVAKVGFTADRLIRFQAKIGDVVLGPAVAPAGQLEPHPFAKVLTGLMDVRGISVKSMSRGTFRSMSTIHMLRRGSLNPKPDLTRQVAEVLGMSEPDLGVIAGHNRGT